MWARILNEPTLLIDALRAIVTLVVLVGWWPLDNATQSQLLITASAVLAVLNRALVTPNIRLSAGAELSPPGPPA